MKKKVTVCWFRRDLRLNDHAALHHALKSGFPVLPVFIFDTRILGNLENKADPRVTFIIHRLKKLNMELSEKGTSFLVLVGPVLEAWKKLTEEYDVREVMANEDYEPYARQRDSDVETYLTAAKIRFRLFRDQVIFNPREVLRDNGNPYTIFTPYKNKWRSLIRVQELRNYAQGRFSGNWVQEQNHAFPSWRRIGFRESQLNVPEPYVDPIQIRDYASSRDFPAKPGTTRLSVHLRFGTISIRQLVKETFDLSETFINELIWREFYMMILWHFPHVEKQSFKPACDRIRWRNNEAEFGRWCQGLTGYPLVDAGMRELNETGFMHNRLRMITASFLCKHLLIDWRWGEAWFASRLLDFELSSNNGGWQWAAGTGCDAAPWFRIFNPYEQTRKFDPRFEYIRKWVPEFETRDYPRPMVEHAVARERCLRVYRESLQGVEGPG